MRNDVFERLYAEHAQALFAFLRYRTGDPALTEELMAETFERALRARRRFDPRRGSGRRWLCKIALNCLSDHARRRQSESRALERVAVGAGVTSDGGLEEIDELADRELEDVAERDRLARSLALLSDVQREAIALRYGADLTNPEIAKLTGESLTTIEGRIYRALRKLRDAMEREGAPL
jgi:RNA polymerase sigma-70 factor (ECF subfamily)